MSVLLVDNFRRGSSHCGVAWFNSWTRGQTLATVRKSCALGKLRWRQPMCLIFKILNPIKKSFDFFQDDSIIKWCWLLFTKNLVDFPSRNPQGIEYSLLSFLQICFYSTAFSDKVPKQQFSWDSKYRLHHYPCRYPVAF